MSVNTAKVEGRRKLDYASFDELLTDADRLSSGPMKVLGNWSAGQIFRHLAIVYNQSIDGFTITFPWYFRIMAKIFRNKLITARCRQASNCRPRTPGFRARTNVHRRGGPGRYHGP